MHSTFYYRYLVLFVLEFWDMRVIINITAERFNDVNYKKSV